MPTRDPEKNRQYVAKHRAMMKANEETKKNIINLMLVILLNMQHRKKKK